MSFINPTGNVLADQNALMMETFHGRDKYEIVSIFSYLIGVPKNIIDKHTEESMQSKYRELNLKKNARIIRNLCLIRNQIEQNYGKIYAEMNKGFRSILSMPEYVSGTAITELSNDGIRLYKQSNSLIQYILDINGHISNRINNCKDLFPTWICWDYIRELFIMPNGLTVAGAKAAADLYYSHLNCYPYGVYMNWTPCENGNILYNDRKFVTLLYEWNEDEFNDNSKVSDVSSVTKHSIYDFIDEGENIVFVVDCENSDPYNLCATINSLEPDELKKVSKIILFDDVHTSSAWALLESQISIPVEHLVITRVKENKSLVDIRLSVGVCKEFYENHADSFVLVSSDSDYWGLISVLEEARFLVMVEHDKCGPDIKNALISSGIYYCYIDDFYSGSGSNLKEVAIMREMEEYIEEHVRLNLHDMLETALTNARVDMDVYEKKQFSDKYVKTIKMVIEDNGDVKLELKKVSSSLHVVA